MSQVWSSFLGHPPFWSVTLFIVELFLFAGLLYRHHRHHRQSPVHDVIFAYLQQMAMIGYVLSMPKAWLLAMTTVALSTIALGVVSHHPFFHRTYR